MLGTTLAASTVWRVVQDTGLPPAPRRASESWLAFLRAQAAGIIACDFITVDLADLAVVRRRDRLGGLLHEYETAA